jgi:hypothetical protein
MSEIQAKVDQLNKLHAEIQSYKKEHPESRLGYWLGYDSLLNAYREGDISFDDCVEAMNSKARSSKYDEALILLDRLLNAHDSDAVIAARGFMEDKHDELMMAITLQGLAAKS